MSNILISGGAGFIGSHLVDALILSGHEIVVLDNLSTGNVKNINEKSICYYDDIRIDLNHIFEEHKIDYIFHLAAQINLRESIKKPAHDAYINIYGSLNLIEMAIKYKVKKFIFSSTGGAIYSPIAELPWTTETQCDPLSPYGLSKLTVEKYLKLIKQNNELFYTALRYSNVFGPRQNSLCEAGVVSIFTDNALAGKPLKIFGDGNQTRDFVYVNDVVNANIIAMNSNINGVFNISTNAQTSVNDIAKLILEKTGSKSIIEYLPEVAGEVKHTRIEYDLPGWEPVVKFEEGIDETLKWFCSQ